MSAYIVVEIMVHDPVSYDRYKLMAPPSIAQFGGRYLVRGGATTTLEGTWGPSRLVILEFPDAERAQAWWSSDEYADAKALRQASARTQMLLVDGIASPVG